MKPNYTKGLESRSRCNETCVYIHVHMCVCQLDLRKEAPLRSITVGRSPEAGGMSRVKEQHMFRKEPLFPPSVNENYFLENYFMPGPLLNTADGNTKLDMGPALKKLMEGDKIMSGL